MKLHGWIMKRKDDPEDVTYRRLDGANEIKEDCVGVPKGCVPLLVGSEEERMKRFVIHTKLFKHPSMLALLEMAEQEYGYNQPGILRIPCDVEYFQRVIRSTDFCFQE
ncbi:auxin-responsive protein SAUR71-like protein [Cinnamomum micranthum f. kanehirae]|uniref:Auxin-responsive protein SAUR71-like protein n=1 Tax=Cinnamomum micranthum f. kanehirae TaxID=337451 RepID=A0A3S4PAU8_9MAGN|nr:auxin-responsive protein SAUR71-like protein [Cinnamomum micranthum f. kanehirae]